MTAVPLPPAHLLTVTEYAALGEDEHGRWELAAGTLASSPSPSPDHNTAVLRIAMQLTPQLPGHVEVIPDIDVDLQLVPPDQPGFARRPDVILAQQAARHRVRAEGGLIRACEVLLIVEVVSPGSRRIDNVVKRAEYADAGIPHYWIVDIDQPVSEPFPVHLDLDALRR